MALSARQFVRKAASEQPGVKTDPAEQMRARCSVQRYAVYLVKRDRILSS
jgi:hypothetical protein